MEIKHDHRLYDAGVEPGLKVADVGTDGLRKPDYAGIWVAFVSLGFCADQIIIIVKPRFLRQGDRSWHHSRFLPGVKVNGGIIQT